MDPNYYPMDFSAYLHNPYGFPTNIEKAAILYFTSKKNVFLEEQLLELLLKYFGNIRKLRREGLDAQYNALKTEVIEKNLIGLILWGTNDIPDADNMLVSKYTTPTGNEIELKMIKNVINYIYLVP